MRRTLVSAVGLLTAVLLLPASALAAAPENDVHPGLTIESLPFTHSTDTTDAEIHAMEPAPECSLGSPTAWSVWYNFTPDADVELIADTFGSDYDTVIDVWQGMPADDFFDPHFEALPYIGCNNNTADSLQSQLRFSATGGELYLIRVTGIDGGGLLTFHLAQAPRPLPNVAMRPTAPESRALTILLGMMFLGLSASRLLRISPQT
jgi:hypothetical protein